MEVEVGVEDWTTLRRSQGRSQEKKKDEEINDLFETIEEFVFLFLLLFWDDFNWVVVIVVEEEEEGWVEVCIVRDDFKGYFELSVDEISDRGGGCEIGIISSLIGLTWRSSSSASIANLSY